MSLLLLILGYIFSLSIDTDRTFIPMKPVSAFYLDDLQYLMHVALVITGGDHSFGLIMVWYHPGNISGTVYPEKYAHGFVVLCFVVVMQSFIMNSYEVFIHIHQGCFAGTEAIVRMPQCQWSKPDGYGKISQCITTTKHSKAKTVCIFLGIYCTLMRGVATHICFSGPCLTTAIWRCRNPFSQSICLCRNPFSQWHRRFQRKLRSHWLKFLRQRHIAVVRQGPGRNGSFFQRHMCDFSPQRGNYETCSPQICVFINAYLCRSSMQSPLLH